MIEVYARPLDVVEWICPLCSAMHVNRFIWRRAHIRCLKCRKYFRLGMGFNLERIGVPPYNATFSTDWTGVANTLHKHVGVPSTARLTGRIDWVCPRCNHPQMDRKISWDTQAVTCYTCGAEYFIHVILYLTGRGQKKACPLDWAPLTGYKPYEKPISSSPKSVVASKVSEK